MTLNDAATRALQIELAIILQAAHQIAGGWPLAWDDYDRIHEAHQHVLKVLAALMGREVMT